MRKLAVWVFLAGSLMAAPRLVTVQDTLYKADGTKFNGVVLIDWRSFQTSDNSNITTQSLVVPVTDGVLRVLLAPTTTAQGAAHYDVRYNSDGRVLFVEKWNVPPSTTTLALRDVRAADGTTPPGQTAILIGDVTGLEDELSARPSKDTSYASGRVVISTSSGTIGSAFGSPSDCVRVDGTSTPCGGSSTGGAAAAFADGEVPIGAINGSNSFFTLTGTPSPAASLAMFRNGVLQKQGLDYSVSGNTVTFMSSSRPETGDLLIANYRTSASGAANVGFQASPAAAGMVASTPGTSQIICNSAGASTSSLTPVKLGSCAIPAELIQPGDRFEIRYGFSHEGVTSGFTITATWGTTMLLSRTATAAERAVVGTADYAVSEGGALWSSQSWGSALAFYASAGTTQESPSNGIIVGIYSQMPVATQDTVSLRNMSVVRYPAQSSTP